MIKLEKLESIRDRSEYLKFIITTEPSEGAISYEEIQRDFSG